jgi:uncharacterized cupin superfamily protein
VKVYNLFDGELDVRREQPGFSWTAAKVGEAIGGEKLGASLYELAPGEKSFPYHYEYGCEEWLICVAGRPVLRSPDGEQELRPGDTVAFPEGPDGAHQVINRSDEPVRVLLLSTKAFPAVAVYPDSGKVGVWTRRDGDDLIVRKDDAVDYWDGEER